MTGDQFRVRVTVTVTLGDGRQGRRSSMVERIDDGPVTANRMDNFLTAEVSRLFVRATAEASK